MLNNKHKYDCGPISKRLDFFEEKLSKLKEIRYIKNPEYFNKEAAYWKKIINKFPYYFHFSNIKYLKPMLNLKYKNKT